MDCHWFKTNHCRSCTLLDLSYAESIALKEKKLHELFSGTKLELLPTVGLANVEGSRNKAKLAVFGELDHIQFGFYDSTLQFRDLEECPLHMDGMNELLPLLKKELREFKIPPYSLKDKKGELKYLILSKSEGSQEFLVRFVLRSKESLDRLKKMAIALKGIHPRIKVVTANIQPEHKAVLEGDEEIILTEESHIAHKFGEVTLSLGPRSFFQVTPEIAAKLYQAAGDVVRDYKIDSFLDLYCGVGAFSFFAAQNAKRVFGVEISKEAIVSAKSTISKNKIKGSIDFEALDVEDFLSKESSSYEAILVNPPRRGLNESIVKSLLHLKPKLIIYSSCNAQTLARDYALIKDDYEISRAQIFDMFPYTEHFETLMVMNRRGA